MDLLLGADLFFGERVAQPHQIAERHRRLFRQRRRQGLRVGLQRVYRGNQLNAGVNRRLLVVDDPDGNQLLFNYPAESSSGDAGEAEAS